MLEASNDLDTILIKFTLPVCFIFFLFIAKADEGIKKKTPPWNIVTFLSYPRVRQGLEIKGIYSLKDVTILNITQ